MQNRTHHHSASRYPRTRIDALTDGIFAVAMTLLGLDIHLPDDFHPRSDADLLLAVWALANKFFPYAMTFFILGLRWLSLTRANSRDEYLSGPYVRWWMVYLFLITCMPFSTITIGRFADFAPAIWLYAGNTALIALASWRMVQFVPDPLDPQHARERAVSMAVLLASSLLCIGWSLLDPRSALWAIALNAAAPLLSRFQGVRR